MTLRRFLVFLENPFHRLGVAKAMVKCNTTGQIIADSSYTAIDQEVKEASERSLKGRQVDPRLGGGGICC